MKKIPLTQGQFALVDDEDFERVNSAGKWTFWTNGNNQYAYRYFWVGKIHKYISMHRFILSAPKDKQIDHRDGNGINNQKTNLRLCTQSQNGGNSRIAKDNQTGYKGVCFMQGSYGINPWHARIRVKRRLLDLGFFPSAQSAAVAYNKAALANFGEFARLNPI
jgi:hypothetical protein